jgi:uncharacterized protein (TIGR03437 family)
MDKSKWRRTQKAGNTVLLTALAAVALNAQSLTTLETFGGAAGVQPMSITRGTDGNFYGTTFGSPTVTTAQYGTIFKVTPSGAFSTLYTFCTKGTPCSDGANPTGLTQGTDGNFYGATTNYGVGGGTIFRITPAGAFTTLYTFTATDGTGGSVTGNLIQGTDGNFYGMSGSGGAPGVGTIFKVSTSGAFTTIYTFTTQLPGGQNPSGGLVQGTDGNFYGTTIDGGTGGNGIVFRITPGGAITTLYNFPLGIASQCLGALTQGTDGDFYGATSQGGLNSGGEIFRITPGGTFTVLYNFLSNPSGSDGANPAATLVQGANGYFYGSTEYGGNPNGYGTIFSITASGTLTTLYAFSHTDGEYPLGVALDTSGNLYGVTSQGGSTNYGTVFRLALPSITLPAPTITSGGVVPIYSTSTTIQPGEWVSIYGNNLAPASTTWTGNFPISLDGTSVTINGKTAFLYVVSPTQINLQAPDDTATGTVPVVVTTGGGNATSSVTLSQFAPSFSLLDSKHVAGIIIRSDGSGAYGGGTYDIIGPTGNSLGYATVAAKAGDSIELYGVGFGPTDPAFPSGQAVPAGVSGTAINPIHLLIGGISLTPGFAGITEAGLFQFNLTLPAGLGTGDVSLIGTVAGVQTESGVVISLQ